MRTNIELDDGLIEEARLLTGLQTKKAVVEEALRVLIASRRRRSLLDLEGASGYAGAVALYEVVRQRDCDTRTSQDDRHLH